MKVMLSGSRSIKSLPEKVKLKLKDLIKENTIFLIGDADGADVLFQDYLKNLGYKNVEIYHVDELPRHNLGFWETKYINPMRKTKNWLFYTKKDIEMTKDSDFSIVLWDGQSEGSVLNCHRALSNEKKVYLLDEQSDKEIVLNKLFEFEKYFQDKVDPKIYVKIKKVDKGKESSKQSLLF
jgi:hypothetical protein